MGLLKFRRRAVPHLPSERMSPWKSGNNRKDTCYQPRSLKLYFFLSSSTFSTASFLSLLVYFCPQICPSSNCPLLALVSLARSLSCPLLFCRPINKFRILTFTGNASKAPTILISNKPSYSSLSLPFDDVHFPLWPIKSSSFATSVPPNPRTA